MDSKDFIELMDRMQRNHKEVSEKLNSVDKTLVKQHEQLTYHIKRTDLLEEKVEVAKEEFKKDISQIKADTAPVHQHVDRVQFLFKAIKWIGLTIVTYAISNLIKLLTI